MSHTPKFDVKVSTILDATKSGERTCKLTGKRWTMDEDEIEICRKFSVPPSAVAPQTRWQHHGAWYVGFQLWYQKHPETGAPVICTVHPSSGVKVLPDKEWFTKDFVHAGRDVDVVAPFFPQWRALQLAVPMPANRNHIEPVNSVAFVSQGDENSMFVGASKTKDSLYCHVAMDTEDSAEVYQGFAIQSSFNIVHSRRIYECQFVRESADCMKSAFLFDCRNCENCFGATNRRNAKYLWFNEQLTKTEWERRRAGVGLGSRVVAETHLKQFRDLMERDAVWPENFNEQVSDSSGEYLTKTTRVTDSYFCEDGATDLTHCNFSVGRAERCAYTGYPVGSADVYYSASLNRSQMCKFCFLTIGSRNMEYCLLCYNCEDCFGCVGLQHKKFCILNKQYTEAEYWETVDALKCAMLERGEYGEFFPAGYSPSYWKDSGAPVWFGMTEEEARGIGCMFYDPEGDGAVGDLATAAQCKNVSELPDHCKDLAKWANVALYDDVARRRFSLIPQEVDFYARHTIAPPRKHFIARMQDLWAEANCGVFMEAACTACGRQLRVAQNPAHAKRKFLCRTDYLAFLERLG
ncbi:hypothetical protein HYW18_02680 [Candidatus Uhrbacteria bacterium]|nr:hypothetical protein [Candidatus Uhrbacteria bacterium]